MLSRLKGYVLIALAAGAFYFLLSYHFIFFSLKDVELLKKTEPTLKYTFYSLQQHTPFDTLRIKALRDAGIENIMLDRGMITEQRLNDLLKQIDAKN
jgi:hypothetical protein